MRGFLARIALKRFAARYSFDVSDMQHMLAVSPRAFFRFAALTKLALHREAVPEEAVFAAKIVGAAVEDCGPCTQLAVDMAAEAGIAAEQIHAVLRCDPGAMQADTLVAFRFAQALAGRQADLDEAREAVAARWGRAAVIDLTLAVQIGRVFPMVKAGLGFHKSCQRVRLGDASVDVARHAA